MKLIDVMNRAAEGYPDEYLRQYFNEETGEFEDHPTAGDTLAKFIVLELTDAWQQEVVDSMISDPQIKEDAALAEMIRRLERAVEEIQSVQAKLLDL